MSNRACIACGFGLSDASSFHICDSCMHRAQQERERRIRECSHDKLTPNSGGYYIVCVTCSARWVAIKSSDDETKDGSRNVPGFASGTTIWSKQ